MGYYTKVDPSKPAGSRCSVYEDVTNTVLVVVEGYFPYFNEHFYLQYLPNNEPTRRAIVYRARQSVGPDGSTNWVPVLPELVLCRP